MLEDEALVRLYLDGDEKAFEELFDRYRPRMFHFVLRMLGNRARAEEVFQEVFLRVHGKLGQYTSRERFAAWLFTIAHHACLDELRKRKRERWLLFPGKLEEPPSTQDPEQEISRMQWKEKILKQVEQLDSKQKEVFLLRIHGNLLFREIADLLKIPLNTVLVRYHQAVQAVKESLRIQNI